MDCTFGCCTTTSSSQRRAERAGKTHFDFTPNLDRSFKATSPNQSKKKETRYCERYPPNPQIKMSQVSYRLGYEFESKHQQWELCFIF